MRFRLAATLTMLAFLAACGSEPSGPERDGGTIGPTGPGPQGVAPSNPYCEPVSASEIEAAISSLFFKNQWPDANSALGKFKNVQNLLTAGSLLDAQKATHDLVKFIGLKFSHLTPEQQAATQADYDALVAELYCFVGISGQVYDINPGDPPTAFATEDGQGGIWFPPDAVFQGTLISVQNITNLFSPPDSPLLTVLDKYPTYLLIEKFPDAPLNLSNGKPVVVTCFPPATPLVIAQRLLLGHQQIEAGTGNDLGFELLADVEIPPELEALLQCPEITAQSGTAPAGFFGQMVQRVTDLLLPPRLHAFQEEFAFGGASGSPEEFSPFGATDPELSALGGASGSPEEFAPPAFAPGLAPPTVAVSGTVGDSTDTGLPEVTVQTGQGTAVPGVTVTFTLAPAATVAPAGAARLCATGGVVPASVDVVTDANGKAALPCLHFGTVAGFSNLQATFDPSSLNFPGAELVSVVSAGSSDNSLNWLVLSNAGPAYSISIVEGNNHVAPAFSNVPNPQPKVLVQDQFGNAAPGAGVAWSPSQGLVSPTASLTDANGHSAINFWTLGPGINTLLSSINAGTPSVQSVLFTATGTFELTLANGCATGGQKDDVTQYGFRIASDRKKHVFAVGLNLSSNGAPGSSEDYEITLIATRGTDTWTSKGRLQSSSNSSKGTESEVIFDFSTSPIPPIASGPAPDISFSMLAKDVTGGTPAPLPPNRVVNMNGGQCQPNKRCKVVLAPGAGSCSITETKNSDSSYFRDGLPAKIYVNK